MHIFRSHTENCIDVYRMPLPFDDTEVVNLKKKKTWLVL